MRVRLEIRFTVVFGPFEQAVIWGVMGHHEAGHAMDGCNVDPCLTALESVLIVLRQPLVSVEPTGRALHNPAPLLHLEPHRAIPAGHDVQDPCGIPAHPVGQRAVVGIGPDARQPRQPGTDPLEHFDRPIPVRWRCGQDRQPPDQPQRVNQHMPLAAGDFFSPRRIPWGRRLRSSSRSGCR